MKDSFSPLIENAIRLANYWHQGQKRRESEFDYFTHLTSVAMILSRSNFDEQIISVGFCHHLIDGSECPASEIISVLGQENYHMIEILSEENESTNSEEWKVEKEKYIEKVKNSSEKIKAVLVADRIANIQVMMEVLDERGLNYFDGFVVGPEEILWYEDNLCMILEEGWQHPILAEYDRLIDEFVDFLERLDEGEDLDIQDKKIQNRDKITDFDKPVEEEVYQESVVKPKLVKIEKKESAPLPSINKVNKRRSKRKSLVVEDATKGTYLSDDEFTLLMPAVLQLAISQEKLTNQMLQDKLKMNYLTGYRILKELKKMHIISKADTFKPRKVKVSKASEFLREMIS